MKQVPTSDKCLSLSTGVCQRDWALGQQSGFNLPDLTMVNVAINWETSFEAFLKMRTLLEDILPHSLEKLRRFSLQLSPL